VYILLGDFNACVGCRIKMLHGVMSIVLVARIENDTGRYLLSFCLIIKEMCVTLGIERGKFTNRSKLKLYCCRIVTGGLSGDN